jgi:hypothetical protein
MSERPLLAVLTSLRVGADYLPSTIRGLERTGALEFPGDRVIYSDGPVGHASFVGWKIVILGASRLGPSLAGRAVLEHASDRPWMLFFEDDLDIAATAVATMANAEVPEGAAFLSFYDPRELPEGKAPGVYSAPILGSDGRGFWGSLALRFPGYTLRWLGAAPRDEWAARPHAGDVAMSRVLLASPWPRYAIHVPSLVDHVGTVSSVAGRSEALPPNRRARNFAR